MNTTISFEGLEIKAWKDGKFRCPFNCHRTDYPRPKWGTEKGFLRHLKECPKSPSAIERLNMSSVADKERYSLMKSEILADFPHKIGDTLFCVKEIVVQPTHVQKGSHMVKVRYEAVKRFEAYEFELKSIDFIGEGISENYTSDYVINNMMLLNRTFRLSDLKPSLAIAKEEAERRQKDYDKYVAFSSYCR